MPVVTAPLCCRGTSFETYPEPDPSDWIPKADMSGYRALALQSAACLHGSSFYQALYHANGIRFEDLEGRLHREWGLGMPMFVVVASSRSAAPDISTNHSTLWRIKLQEPYPST